MKTHLTAQEFGLYLLCPMQIERGLQGWLQGVNAIDETVLLDWEEDSDYYPFSQVKPILRKLSDMTEEEKQLLNWAHNQSEPTCYPAKEFKYLLSIGIDLFGYIESGLAIDQATIKQQ